jgi:hypothetical protein
MKIRILAMIELVVIMFSSLKIKTINNINSTTEILEYASSQIYFSYLDINKISQSIRIFLDQYEINLYNEEENTDYYRFTLSKKYFSYLTNSYEPLIIEKYFNIKN